MVGGSPSDGVVVETAVGDQVGDQIHHARLREPRNRNRLPEAFEMLAGLRVERMQEERGRDHVDHQPPVHLRVGDPLPVARTHGFLKAPRIRLAIGPQRLSRRRIHRHDGSPITYDREELPVDVARGGLRKVARLRPVVVAPPHPGDFQIGEVVRIDVVKRRGASAPGVSALVAPFPFGHVAVLRHEGRRQQQRDRQAAGDLRRAFPRRRKRAHSGHLEPPVIWEAANRKAFHGRLASPKRGRTMGNGGLWPARSPARGPNQRPDPPKTTGAHLLRPRTLERSVG